MKYYDGIDFAIADFQLKSKMVKKNYPFYYGLQFVYSGTISLFIDHGKEIRREGPVVFLTRPEHYYEYHSPGLETRDHYWVCFQGSKVKEYLDGELFALNPEKPFFNLRSPEEFLEQMKDLIALIQSGHDHDRAVCLLETLLCTVQSDSKFSGTAPDYYRERFDKLLAKISRNPEKNWDFTEEAAKLSVSLNHFNRLFRKYHKTSPRHCVIRWRMRKAADLLLNTNASVAEISMDIGIENEFYFSRLFKERYGLSPTDYRKEFVFA